MIRTRRDNSNNKAVTGINITPFTDVCLVLLIIFLLTATDLSKRPDSGIKIPLPQADNTTTLPNSPIVLEIDSKANFYINKKLTTLDTLSGDISQIFDKYPTDDGDKRIVVIKADKDISYDYVVKAMDAVGNAGGGTIMLGTDDKTKDSTDANVAR